MKSEKIFITGIGTDVGKTIVSAVLVEKLGASYWKPIQSGASIDSDTNTVASLVTNPRCKMIPESITLKMPLSPHEAAGLENRRICLNGINEPFLTGNLVIEGAGGLLVPINESELIIDLIIKLDAEVILVSRNYLGSINHTLLSLEILRWRGINLKGIIFCGESNAASEKVILEISNARLLGRIPWMNNPGKEDIINAGNGINLNS